MKNTKIFIGIACGATFVGVAVAAPLTLIYNNINNDNGQIGGINTSANKNETGGNGNKPTQPGGGNGTNTGGGNNWNKPTQPGGGNGINTGGGNNWNKPTQPGGGNGTNTGGGNNWNKPTQPGGGNGNWNKPTQPGGGNGNWNKPTQPGGGNGTNTGGNNWNKPTQPGGGNGTNTGDGNNWNKPTQPGGGNGNWNKPTGGGNGNWNKPTQPGGGNGNWNKPTGGGNGNNTGNTNKIIKTPLISELDLLVEGNDGEAIISSQLNDSRFNVSFDKSSNIWNNDKILVSLNTKPGFIFDNNSTSKIFHYIANINSVKLDVKPHTNSFQETYSKYMASPPTYISTGILLNNNEKILVNPGNNENISILINIPDIVKEPLINKSLKWEKLDKKFYLKSNEWNEIKIPDNLNYQNVPLYIQNEALNPGEIGTMAHVKFKADKINFVPTFSIDKTTPQNMQKQLDNNPKSSFVQINSKHLFFTFPRHVWNKTKLDIDKLNDFFKFLEEGYEFSLKQWGFSKDLQGISKWDNFNIHYFVGHENSFPAAMAMNIRKSIVLWEKRSWSGKIPILTTPNDYGEKNYIIWTCLLHELNHSFQNEFFNLKTNWKTTLLETSPDVVTRSFTMRKFSNFYKVINKINDITKKYKNFINNDNQNKDFFQTFHNRYTAKLIPFIQLSYAFGENFWGKVNHIIRAQMNWDTKVNDAKLNQVNLVAWSQAAGINLLPFIKKWGLMPTDETIKKTNALNLPLLIKPIWNNMLNDRPPIKIKDVAPIKEFDATTVKPISELKFRRGQKLTESFIRSKINLPANFNYKIHIGKIDPSNELINSEVMSLLNMNGNIKNNILPSEWIKQNPIQTTKNMHYIGNATFQIQEIQADDKNGSIVYTIEINPIRSMQVQYAQIKVGVITGFEALNPNSNKFASSSTMQPVEILISDNDPNTLDVKKIYWFKEFE